jgi:dihydrofolate reductase
MRKLLVFNNVTLDGFIADANSDMSWAHSQDPEWQAFVAGNAKGESQMLFGRKTYELMASFWPTPQAIQAMPNVAEAMNKAPKVVFSRTMSEAKWTNTTLVKGDPAAEVSRLKNEPGPGLVIFGSGTIVSLLAQEGLIDEFQVVVIPVVLGQGKSMFAGIKDKLSLKLIKTRIFGNGNVLLCYEPVR